MYWIQGTDVLAEIHSQCWWLWKWRACPFSTKVTGAGICTDLWLFAPGRGEAEGLEEGLLVHVGHLVDQHPPAPLTRSPTLALQPHSWRWALSGPALDCGTLAGRKPRPGPSVGGGGGGGRRTEAADSPTSPTSPTILKSPTIPQVPKSKAPWRASQSVSRDTFKQTNSKWCSFDADQENKRNVKHMYCSGCDEYSDIQKISDTNIRSYYICKINWYKFILIFVRIVFFWYKYILTSVCIVFWYKYIWERKFKLQKWTGSNCSHPV